MVCPLSMMVGSEVTMVSSLRMLFSMTASQNSVGTKNTRETIVLVTRSVLAVIRCSLAVVE
jgi:hypothetical protein